ncbi:MAG: protein translocase subunit SecD [Verrucomicrobiae bacterium]|nr:protein translocase subunit SecD [Verrucomicrobiae bacterium]
MKTQGWKWLVTLGLIALAVYGLVTTGINLGLDLRGGTSFKLRLDLSNIDPEGHASARQQAIEIIRKRIDRFGVSEPLIQPEGADRIVVQIPGLSQEQRLEARRTLERTAYLEFRLVHPQNETLLRDEATDPAFVPPVGYQKLTEVVRTREGRDIQRTYYVRIKPELTGKHVRRAYVQFDEIGRPYVLLEFDSEGADIFARITRANVGRQLAIVLDGELYSAPVINEEIVGGRAQITGQFTRAEASQLANVLENPLEAPVQIIEERGVDPSLGRDSIEAGMRAAVLGALAVVVIMLAIYWLAGVVATVALALNLLLLMGALATFKFTLTLPGIAGIVLTIGMAVDAAVLIFERIREELAANKSLRAAITAGFQRAFIVIFDSNLTTILTAMILIWLGSGPVQGFGVVLATGLVVNLFAAVFFMRLIFDAAVESGTLRAFRVLRVIPKTNINFLAVRHVAFVASWLLIAVGLVVFVKRGGLDVGHGAIYGIDFSGGDMVSLRFTQKIDPTQIRQSLERQQIFDALIQYQGDVAGGGKDALVLKLPEGTAEKVIAALRADFPQAEFQVASTERVGAVVGAELLREALWAVVVAMFVIMIYVAFRFGELAYGLGALIALAHDVLMSLAWFCLTGRTFSLPVVAALLTIIGYSINDTIVVFDRIRENRKLSAGRLDYFTLINRSLNETLSRTLLTVATTLAAALALYVFGGRVINDFAFTFLVGIITGTYSSICIASPIVLWFHRHETAREPSRKPAPVRA